MVNNTQLELSLSIKNTQYLSIIINHSIKFWLARCDSLLFDLTRHH